MWKIISPNQITTLIFNQDSNGALTYSVIKNDESVIENSKIGIVTNIGDFTESLDFIKEETKSIRETYQIPAGKKSEYINNCEELALYFKKGEYNFAIRGRVFDEGAAFRYEIISDTKTHTSIQVEYETTEFNFNADYDTLWLQDWIPTYEGVYHKRVWDVTLAGQSYGMPSLFYNSAAKKWVMINEANVINTHGGYCSCHLKGTAQAKMYISFAPEEKGNPISSHFPFQSPWRLIIAENSLDGIVNNTMNYNLNPPSVIEDPSWIKPARTLWAWWEYENGAQLYSESKRYVDFAAAKGFEGVTLDCGWDACWVKDICDYAHARNVQIWIWTGMWKIDTLEKAEKYIPLWASWGVAGLKIDFFENDSVLTMSQYHMMAELMIKHKLMINFHGSTKPMGEGRTWPHFLTAEGIMGLEHYKWSDLPNAEHNCTVPFIRNAAGPMDYTPVGLSNQNRNTTAGHQLALPVVFDSGVTHYAMSLYYLEAWNGTRFLQRTLAHYEGVKVLSGFPGDHTAMLRYTKSEWLIGVITNNMQEIDIALDFLPEGFFQAEIYEDSEKGDMIVKRTLQVSGKDILELRLLKAGGAGIYITKELKEPATGICSGYMSAGIPYFAKDAKLTGGTEPVRWNKELEGIQLIGSADFSITVPESKGYTVRVFYSATKPWTISATSGSHAVCEQMPSSKANTTLITHDFAISLNKGENSLRIKKVSGKVPAISKIVVIDNDPSEIYSYGPELAKLTNGAELIVSDVDGALAAVGLGYEAEMIFENICLPKTGRYIINIQYCGGESRDITIEAGREKVDTYLHSTSGWFFATWENAEGKEILMNLSEGRNTIRLYNKNGRMSHIRGIKISLEADL